MIWKNATIEEDYRQKSILSRASILAVVSNEPNIRFLYFLYVSTYVGNLTLSTQIDQVLPSLPAENVGLMPGDDLIKINGNSITDVERRYSIY